jgi:holliday junction DNA helicase RuvA
MYAHLTGTVVEVGADNAVLDVGGVGYMVHAGARTLGLLQSAKDTKTTTRVFTHLHVREDVMALYGFADTAEKSLFLMLTSVNGLGPRLGLSLLSTFAPDEIVAAIQAGQATTLSRASGVGKKMAEKILLELKDKIGQIGNSLGALGVATLGSSTGKVVDLASALINLGYAPKVAEAAAAEVVKATPDAAFAELFKHALKKVA